ncbi:metal-sensitive transcriptional regulator [Oceanicola granulosus]|uniref:metal-sensitive transcriptional regulator n=1 Tax=Oceanicola granulosus TaxID=252302 RepID=UPI00178C3E55|nr:metal-sensitive transcriptional regulator [Oceanicola granulosus]
MVHDTHSKQPIQTRLSRPAGQVQGVARMVEEDRYRVDILTQTAAIRWGPRAVERNRSGCPAPATPPYLADLSILLASRKESR